MSGAWKDSVECKPPPISPSLYLLTDTRHLNTPDLFIFLKKSGSVFISWDLNENKKKVPGQLTNKQNLSGDELQSNKQKVDVRLRMWSWAGHTVTCCFYSRTQSVFLMFWHQLLWLYDDCVFVTLLALCICICLHFLCHCMSFTTVIKELVILCMSFDWVTDNVEEFMSLKLHKPLNI